MELSQLTFNSNFVIIKKLFITLNLQLIKIILMQYFFVGSFYLDGNGVERYDFRFYKKLRKILRRLISSFSFVNKSLTISMFSFSTAKYNAVL